MYGNQTTTIAPRDILFKADLLPPVYCPWLLVVNALRAIRQFVAYWYGAGVSG